MLSSRSLDRRKEMPSVCTTGGISTSAACRNSSLEERGRGLRGPGPYAPQRSRHAQNESASSLNDHPAVVTVPDDREPQPVLGAAAPCGSASPSQTERKPANFPSRNLDKAIPCQVSLMHDHEEQDTTSSHRRRRRSHASFRRTGADRATDPRPGERRPRTRRELAHRRRSPRCQRTSSLGTLPRIMATQ